MTLLDRFIPNPRLRQVDRIGVATDPAATYDAIRRVDVELFPSYDRVAAHLHGRPPPAISGATVEDLARPGRNFQLLAEDERGFAVGAIGTLWRQTIDFRHVYPERFDAFAEPGYGKVAWGFEVTPRAGGGASIALDWRMTATDDTSFGTLRRHWMWAGPLGHAIRRALLGQLTRELGPVPRAA